MVYQIPDSKLAKLEKQCRRISNKGALIIFDIQEPCQVFASNDDRVSVPGHNVQVEGSYIINDWEFVATIEHTPAGNIIRCINSDLESQILERYKTCGPECEHCHRIRSRKDTYLVHNLKTDDWKQVGKTCLMEYTCGLDSEVCAAAASFFAICDQAQAFDDDGCYGYSSDKEISARIFKMFAYPIIKKNGYRKDCSIDRILDAIFKRGRYYDGSEVAEKATDEEIEEINNYAKNTTVDDYGYFRNATLAWAKDYLEYRDLALVASFIGTYFKHQTELAKREHNSQITKYVGQVSEKLIINVKSIRVLYVKDNRAYSYYAEPSTVYEIVDTDGNTFICDTSKDLARAETIRGTVKTYREFRGVKQTVITRVKVLKEKEVTSTSSKSAEAGFDRLISYMED